MDVPWSNAPNLRIQRDGLGSFFLIVLSSYQCHRGTVSTGVARRNTIVLVFPQAQEQGKVEYGARSTRWRLRSDGTFFDSYDFVFILWYRCACVWTSSDRLWASTIWRLWDFLHFSRSPFLLNPHTKRASERHLRILGSWWHRLQRKNVARSSGQLWLSLPRWSTKTTLGAAQ